MNKTDQYDIIKKEIRSREWFHNIEVLPGLYTNGRNCINPEEFLNKMGLPEDLSNKTVLDIGCHDGMYSLELSRRNAKVHAIDFFSKETSNVQYLSTIMNRPITYVQRNILDLNEDIQFDIIIFMGVLYHLRYPFLVLNKLNHICKDILIVESEIEPIKDNAEYSIEDNMFCRFIPRKFLGDGSNWWVPTVECLKAMIQCCGFEIIQEFPMGINRYVLLGNKKLHIGIINRSPEGDHTYDYILKLQKNNE